MTGTWLDNKAVWRQALAQVAALHGLDDRLGYGSVAVDTLLSSPRGYPVTVRGTTWKRKDPASDDSYVSFGASISRRPPPRPLPLARCVAVPTELRGHRVRSPTSHQAL